MSPTFAQRKCKQNEYVMNDVIAVIAATDRTLKIFIFSASASETLGLYLDMPRLVCSQYS